MYQSLDGMLRVKVSLNKDDSHRALRKEAQTYDVLKDVRDVQVAKYGLFVGMGGLVLILSNEGEPVCFESMSNADRQVGTGGLPGYGILIFSQV